MPQVVEGVMRLTWSQYQPRLIVDVPHCCMTSHCQRLRPSHCQLKESSEPDCHRTRAHRTHVSAQGISRSMVASSSRVRP